MRNTKAEYLSTERKPKILPELETLLPPLSKEQTAALEEDILQNGCYSPIIVNEDMVIIDGHNRHSICEKHGIPYRMAVFAFDSMLEAKQWMISTQRGRRNLEPWELGKVALQLKPEIEAKARANLVAGGLSRAGTKPSASVPKVSAPVDTRKELAESVGLGERTMGKVMQIDAHAPAPVKEALDRKEISVSQGYDITQKLRQFPEERREQAALEAVEWAKAQKGLKKRDAEIDRRAKIAKSFSKAFEMACQMEVTRENVFYWTDCSRMKPSEMELNTHIARKLGQAFLDVADIIEQEIMPADGRCQKMVSGNN